MKKILITGANSYIGTSFENYIKENFPDRYTVDTIDMIDGSWREKSFSGYDAVFHVAGIAHSDSGKISVEKEKLYYEVNADLTIESAKKAKADGVKQFIFMSSAIVYGDSAPIGRKKVITTLRFSDLSVNFFKILLFLRAGFFLYAYYIYHQMIFFLMNMLIQCV